ncbi:MAG: protein kinase [Myxococcales bacterium]|nr:protein kinase [Myxococcales bacterium]MCB9531878.1 protein kinase [Myxococcales bacterium]
MHIAEFLAQVPPFDTLSPSALGWLVAQTTLENHRAGDLIIRKGDLGEQMYVVFEGEVAVPVEHADGRTRFRARLPPRHFFGEMAILTEERRNADVFAATDCVLLAIPGAAVLDLVEESVDVASFLTEVLGERLMETGGIRKVGKYQLVRKIGRGGMSVVFEGRHPDLERPVAVKMLSHGLVHRRNFAERFRNEGKIIASLNHPNIVDVFDMEEAYATFFIVMEKLEGRDLSDVIEQEGPIEAKAVRRILRQVAEALDYAHSKGVVHRDVKPSNVAIDDAGNVKLMDFGLAKVNRLEAQLQEDADIVLGTPYYMSPEQARGDELDLRTDIYNLGILAFEMLTGQRPYSGRTKSEVQRKHVQAPVPSVRSILPDVPSDLEAFVTKALQKHPIDRFQTCREVLQFLARSGSTVDLRVRTIRLAYPGSAELAVEAAVRQFEAAIRAARGAEISIDD